MSINPTRPISSPPPVQSGDPHDLSNVRPEDLKPSGPDLIDPKLEAPTKIKVARQNKVKFGDKPAQTFEKNVEVDITNMRIKADAEKPSF